MTIALVPSAFHPSLGGVEELTRQLAHRLVSPLVITQRWPRDLPAYEDFEGLQLHRFPFRAPTGGAKALTTFPPSRVVVARQLTQLLKAQRVSVVHVQCVSATAYYAAVAARRLSLPLVVSLQGELTMDASGLFQRSRFMRHVMRSVLDAADVVTACTAATLVEAEDFRGAPFGARGLVIHNGVTVSELVGAPPYQHARPYVLALGRHVPQKGFDVLIRAWARLDGTHDLLLAGDGPQTGELADVTAALGLTDRVHFLGRADRRLVASLFAGCDLFVMPSRHEPQGIVALEAMAAAKAVVASNVGGVAEVVLDGVTGRLVPGGDEGALAAAVAALLADPQARQRLGAAGRERAMEFDWARVAARYQAVYERVTSPIPVRTGRDGPEPLVPR